MAATTKSRHKNTRENISEEYARAKNTKIKFGLGIRPNCLKRGGLVLVFGRFDTCQCLAKVEELSEENGRRRKSIQISWIFLGVLGILRSCILSTFDGKRGWLND